MDLKDLLSKKNDLKKVKLLAGVALLVLVFIGFAVSAKNQKVVDSKPRIERYFISSKEKPNFKEVILNPFDFKPGEEQITYVKLENPNPIESVTAIITTDKLVKTYELKLFEGNSTAGTWKGSWRINDTHNYTYRQTFKAVSGRDKSQVDLTFK